VLLWALGLVLLGHTWGKVWARDLGPGLHGKVSRWLVVEKALALVHCWRRRGLQMDEELERLLRT